MLLGSRLPAFSANLTALHGCYFCTPLQKELDHADKMILYAPPHDDARDMMLEILKELAIEDHRWILHPVPTTPETTTTNAQYNMRCSKLSDLLEHAVETARNRRHPIPTTVVLMGMDSPILPMDELIAACQTSASAATNEREDNRNIAPLISALLCPADDGGYGLLSVPPTANAASIFRTVEWSHRLTSVSQLKALTDNNIPVILGPLMYDIDTQEDMQAWIRRNLDSSGSTVLPIPPSPSSIEKTQSVSLHCCLNRPSGWVNGSQLDIKPATGTATMTAVHTRNALLDLGLLQAQRMTNVEMPTNAGANNR